MVINVNSVTTTQQQNNISNTTQEVQSTQNSAQAFANSSSTHNLYHAINLNNRLLDPNITQQIIKNARLNKDLETRTFREINNSFNTSSTPLLSPPLLDDLYKKLMNLQSNGHLRNLMRSFQRRAKRGQSTDQAYGNSNIKEEHMDLAEKEKVKRKEGQTINQETINDVIKDSLKNHDNPVQRFLLLSMSANNPTGDAQFDKAVQEALDALYEKHGVEIRAKINSLEEAYIYGKNGRNSEKITQFSENYYNLIQAQTWMQVFSILKECSSIEEFNEVTNLMNIAAKKDSQAKTLPTSDPNTIHNLLSFMNIRSSIISFCKASDKFRNAFRIEERESQRNKQEQEFKDEENKKNIKKKKPRIGSVVVLTHPKIIL